MKAMDLTGQRYGMLVAVSKDSMAGKTTLWRCRCDCGRETVTRIGNLRNGHTKSCGCLSVSVARKRATTHGKSNSREHNSWAGMLSRCLNPKDPRYPRYGGRGIKVCARWKKFENFLADMGERPNRTSIGRKDNNGKYCKRNCQWETPTQQARNKSNTRRHLFNGFLATTAEHCERLGLKASTVARRIRVLHWPIDKAFSTN